MKQMFIYKNLFSSILRVILFISIISFSSCDEENNGEYKLTGDISNLIPDNAYSLDMTGSEGYISYMPNLSGNFEVWGLKIKKVDYFVDGEKYFLCGDVRTNKR